MARFSARYVGMSTIVATIAAVAITSIVVGSIALDNTNSQSQRNEQADIIDVLSCLSVGLSQKNPDAYTTYMLPDAYIDFSEVGAPMPGSLTDVWLPFQLFVWEMFVQTQTLSFPNPCVTFAGSRNATVVAAYQSLQSAYTVEVMGDSRLPAIITASTCTFGFYKTDTAGWKITSMVIQPNGTVVSIAPTLSGVVDPPVKRTRDLTPEQHYFQMLLEYYQRIQRPDLVAILQANPEFIKVMMSR